MEKIPNSKPLKVLLTNTKVPRNTKTLVSNVKERWSRQMESMDLIFDALNHISSKAAKILTTNGQKSQEIQLEKEKSEPESMKKLEDSIRDISLKSGKDFALNLSQEDYHCLEEMTKISQGLLEAIGVSHESISRVCRITEKVGFASKLTGAGGGGCVLTLLPSGNLSFLHFFCFPLFLAFCSFFTIAFVVILALKKNDPKCD